MGDIERHAMAAIDWASGPGEFYLDTWSMLFHPFGEWCYVLLCSIKRRHPVELFSLRPYSAIKKRSVWQLRRRRLAR
jgi:hypothetical protein